MATSNTYPRTLHHPDPKVGATAVVHSKEWEDRWVKQGWRLTPPGEKTEAPEAEKKS